MIAGLKPYPAYKASGSRWLATVPSHWEVHNLRTLIRRRNERNRADLPLLSVARENGVFVRSLSDANENHNVIPEDLSNYKVARAGNLVINKMKAWQGSMGIAPCDGIVSPAYFVFDFRIANHAFGQKLLRSKQYVAHFGQASDGVRVGQWDLTIAGMRQIPVLVPPPDEQIAIVRFLDHANHRIDRFIKAKKRVIALVNEQKQAIIHRAVTRGLDPNVPLKPSGIEWLGDIPEHWEVRRAKQLCSAIIDCKNRTPDMVVGGEYIVVRTTNIRHGRFNLSGSYPTNRRNYEIWTQRGAPRVGDVFFTREAPAGEACLVPDIKNLCMGQRMMYFRPKPKLLDACFLLYNIYGPVVRTYIEHVSNGSTVGHLRLGQVSSLPLLWCPLEEQKTIVSHIDEASAPLNKIIKRTEREISLLREYRTRLIADVVTGKLDVREAAKKLPEETVESSIIDEDEIPAGDEEMEDNTDVEREEI
jgi:type I restriction enzyme S subunit